MTWKLKTAGLTQEQFDERDRIVKAFVPDRYREFGWTGGVMHYENMDVETLKQLIEKGYADPNDRQNCAPCIKDFVALMEKYPTLKAHGYVVERERNDARISVEGVEGECPSEVSKMFKDADDCIYENGQLYVWYD